MKIYIQTLLSASAACILFFCSNVVYATNQCDPPTVNHPGGFVGVSVTYTGHRAIFTCKQKTKDEERATVYKEYEIDYTNRPELLAPWDQWTGGRGGWATQCGTDKIDHAMRLKCTWPQI